MQVMDSKRFLYAQTKTNNGGHRLRFHHKLLIFDLINIFYKFPYIFIQVYIKSIVGYSELYKLVVSLLSK